MSQHMKIFTDTHLTLIGFILFFVLFLLFCAYTYAPSQKKRQEYLSHLPLDVPSKETP